jgi:tight adherence protein C
MTPFLVATIVHLSALDPRVLLLPLVFGLGVYLIVLSLPFGRPRPDLGERLRRLDVDERLLLEDAGRHTRTPIFASRVLENVLRPVIDDAGRLLRGVLTRFGLADGHQLERRLRVLRPGVEVVQFLGEKVASGLIVAVVFPCMNMLHLTPFGGWPVWVWMLAFAVGFFLPDLDLRRREHARRGLVLMELPTILDLLTLATSAGMALEQALEEVGRHSEGVVAQELRVLARELALGQRRSLQEALDAMSERVNVPEIDHVLARLSATYDQGLPLGQALAAHAQALRERQRLHLVEEGGKATVRMLLPVALLILPPLFVVVLVPAAAELTRLGG